MKKIFTVLLLSIFALPMVGQAHTTLSSSTPAEGEVVVEPMEEVVLTFGTVIEEGSTMTLESEGISYEFDEITVSDEVMTGTTAEELPNGAYTIRWNIIGADGHPIEGEVPFELNVEAVAEEPMAEEEEPVTEEEPVAEEETPAAEEEAPQASENAEEDEGNPIITVLIVVALLVIAFGAYKLLKKK